jgi:hypothetical protein
MCPLTQPSTTPLKQCLKESKYLLFFHLSDYAHVLPPWRQLIWSVLFVLMATVATGGNLIVIWIVMSHKRMRTVTNYFIGELNMLQKATIFSCRFRKHFTETSGITPFGVFSDAFPGHKMCVHAFLTAPDILVIRAVTHQSTDRAQRCLTEVIKWVLVCPTW